MKLRILFVILIFITAALVGLWLFADFSKPQPEPAAPRTEAVKPPPTPAFERDEKIQSETDALLYLFDKMPSVPVYLKDEVINREGTNTERGVAYTTCENDDQPTIYVKKVFYQKANRKQLVNILKHELTHAWQCRRRYAWGHDERFRKKFKEVGGFGN